MLAPNASVTGGTPVTTGSVIIVITFSDSDAAVDDTESTGVVACIATAGGAAGEAMEGACGSGCGRVMMDTEPDLLCVGNVCADALLWTVGSVCADALPWTANAAGHGGPDGNGAWGRPARTAAMRASNSSGVTWISRCAGTGFAVMSCPDVDAAAAAAAAAGAGTCGTAAEAADSAADASSPDEPGACMVGFGATVAGSGPAPAPRLDLTAP